MRTQLFVIVALLVAQVFCIPNGKSFTTDVTITEKDGSVAQASWSYDATQRAEKVTYHRKDGRDTTSFRLYNVGVEYLVIEGETDSCHLLPLADKAMQTPAERATIFTQNKAIASWKNTVVGPVAPAMFALPSSCVDKMVGNGIFCTSCIQIGTQVINLGCNATAGEIANLCGNLFEAVCKMVLDQACAGACQLEECAEQACCLVDLCSGSQCNSSLAVASAPKAPAPVFKVGDGPFCSSCVSIGQEVITLGCNATSSEIANLCGNVFESLCQKVLDTFCSGACGLEDCALQTCCLVDLCSGSQCTNSSTSSVSVPQLTPLRLQ